MLSTLVAALGLVVAVGAVPAPHLRTKTHIVTTTVVRYVTVDGNAAPTVGPNKNEGYVPPAGYNEHPPVVPITPTTTSTYTPPPAPTTTSTSTPPPPPPPVASSDSPVSPPVVSPPVVSPPVVSPPASSYTPVTPPVTPPSGGGQGISITPHYYYSSSIGVLGCKVNTNRIAYFPRQPSCESPCVQVEANGRSVYLLHIDTSGGAWDMSYDAWNYLKTGSSAMESPTYDGGFDATYKSVDMEFCKPLITADDGNLPLMAANSINFYTSCSANSWVGKHTTLWNIGNCACTIGANDKCKLDLAVSNQPACGSSTLGINTPLKGFTVKDIVYDTTLKSAKYVDMLQ